MLDAQQYEKVLHQLPEADLDRLSMPVRDYSLAKGSYPILKRTDELIKVYRSEPKHQHLLSMPLLLKAYKQTGDARYKEWAVDIADDFIQHDTSALRLYALLALSEMSELLEDGEKYAKASQRIAHEQLKTFAVGSEVNAKAVFAAGLLSLQNRHIETFMHAIYIQYARQIIESVMGNIDKLSNEGQFFYRDALTRLLEARKRYKW